MESRDLTKEEVKALSLELRVAYHLFPWNKSARFTDAQGWAEAFWMFQSINDDGEDTPRKDAIDGMLLEHKRLMDFVCDELATSKS